LEVDDSEESEESSNSKDDAEENKGEGDFSHKKKTRSKKEIEKEALASDYYKILNLEDNHGATEAEINRAYKRITLKYHPDKIAARGEKLSEGDKEIWLKIQKAYNILTDADKRRKYDSSLPFDEKIPKEEDVKDPAKFYELFKKCF